MRTTRRGRVVGGVLALAALLGGTAAAVELADEPARPVAVASPTPSPTPTAAVRGALLPPAVDGTRPAEPGLAAAVAAALADPALGGSLAVSVLDADTGDVLHERAADVPLLPASTAKIATAVAALTALPEDLRLRTRVVAGAAPGEVVLVGGGDPTLARPSTPASYPQPARLADLAARTRAALGATAVTRVVVDDSLYSGERLAPGWKPTYVTEGAVAPVTALMVDGGRVGRSRAPPLDRALPRRRRRSRRAAAAGRARGRRPRDRAGRRGRARRGGERPRRAARRADAHRQRQRPRRGAGPSGRARDGSARVVRRCGGGARRRARRRAGAGRARAGRRAPGRTAAACRARTASSRPR
jgi:hypothetical protein